MRQAQFWLFVGLASGVSGCVSAPVPGVVTKDLQPDELPAEVRALAESAEPGFSVSEAQRKVRDGRTYYDVEGKLPDGSEIEFDILITSGGPQIVEVQRDLSWPNVPYAVRSAAMAAAPGMLPARVIESRQTDGTVIYELFAPGAPSDPAMEVSLAGGVASVLAERWPH